MEQEITGTPARKLARMPVATPRRNCAGTASSTNSTPARHAARSVPARIPGSSGSSGRNSGFPCPASIAAATSGSRAQSATSSPARRAAQASAVPNDPAPMMATCVMGEPASA
ncbi:MAG: hypothetical protein M5U07_02960 [Xanthobacteraceae bacterium]|nr:hypothetical protein [Xanthobacteraceae bacterium]